MKRALCTLFAIAVLIPLFADIGTGREAEGLFLDTISVDVTLDGLVARTRVIATIENTGSSSMGHTFSLDPESRYVTSLSIDGQRAYLVRSDHWDEPTGDRGDYGNITGPDIEFNFDLIIPQGSASTIVITLEERLKMAEGGYSYSFPMDSITGYQLYERSSMVLKDLGTHFELGRDIIFDEDGFPLKNVRKDAEGILYSGETLNPSPGDIISARIEPNDREGWYSAYIGSFSGTGHLVISAAPWREVNGTSKMVSYGTPMEINGEILEDLNRIESGEEGIIAGVFNEAEYDLALNMEFSTDSNMIEATVENGAPEVHHQEWAMRYWELAWMDHLLLQAFDSGGGNGSMEKVVDFSTDRSILSPYTSFVIYDHDASPAPGNVEDEYRWDDGDSQELNSGSSSAIEAAYAGWPDWSEYYRDAPDNGDHDLDGQPEEPFMDRYWPFFAAGSLLLILIVSAGAIYSRLKEDDLLKQEKRKAIYEHIMNKPGDHFRSIQRAVDLEVGTLSHHMNILEREQLIVSEQDGNNRRFWVAGVKRDLDKVRLSRIQENILKEIQSEPGITQVQIAKKLGVSRKVVFYHVKFLADSEMVTEEKIKRRAHYYPTD